jgi:hypothetical protein
MFWKLDLLKTSDLTWICFRPPLRRGEAPTQMGPLERANLSHRATHVKVKVTSRRTVSRPVCPSIRPPSRSRDQFLTSMENILRYLRVSSCGTISLTRGRGCNLYVQVLLDLSRAVTIGSMSRRTRDHILLSHLRLNPPSVASYDSQDYGGGILSRLHMDSNISHTPD